MTANVVKENQFIVNYISNMTKNNGELYFKYLLEGKNNTKMAMVFSMSLAILFSLTPKLAYNHVFRLTF